mgnify:CR=1 FL=1
MDNKQYNYISILDIGTVVIGIGYYYSKFGIFSCYKIKSKYTKFINQN